MQGQETIKLLKENIHGNLLGIHLGDDHFIIFMNHELPDVKLALEKAEEPEIKLPTSIGSLRKQEF